MLSRLFVKNFAIIDETDVEFKEKLNILTGETGAGKSILIGSVNAALGEKTSKDIIRYGADYALVELDFTGITDEVKAMLSENDIYPDEDEIHISRKITKEGKSICRINGETVSISELKKCSALLIDIHGQNEHQSLLKASAHVGVIDKYAGDELKPYLEELKTEYENWNKVKKEIAYEKESAGKEDNDAGYLEFAINEIKSAALKQGEDEELSAEFKMLSNSKQIIDSLSKSLAAVSYDNDGNAEDYINVALHSLSRVTEYDNRLFEMYNTLKSASDLLSDFKRDADSYLGDLENFESRFNEVEERLNRINNLKNKYAKINGSISDVLLYMENAEARLNKLNRYDEYIKDLEANEIRLRKKCLSVCERISDIRVKYGKDFCGKITDELKDLNFASPVFSLKAERSEYFTANGFDNMEFMISLNPGEPLKPLIRVASGGELSRVCLAIKTVLADKDEIPTLIFDEIDTGISGRTAQRVAEKMALLARSHQIICITHLAQIASMADTHFLIDKKLNENFVKTEIRELDEKERITEIARILGGATITDTVLDSAKEMISLASKIKTGD